MVVVALGALVPPCPSVPPGALDKPKEATKPRNRAKKVEEGYISRHGDVHTAAIRRHDDGDLLAIS